MKRMVICGAVAALVLVMCATVPRALSRAELEQMVGGKDQGCNTFWDCCWQNKLPGACVEVGEGTNYYIYNPCFNYPHCDKCNSGDPRACTDNTEYPDKLYRYIKPTACGTSIALWQFEFKCGGCDEDDPVQPPANCNSTYDVVVGYDKECGLPD